MTVIRTKNMAEAAFTISGGGVVIVATETFYCIAASPFNEDAVRRIFSIKDRPLDKPLPLISASVENVRKVIADESIDALELATEFWPGSFTILLKLTIPFSGCLRDGQGRVGVRTPTACPASLLAEMSGIGWITATSANLSSGPNAAIIDDIPEPVIKSVDCVVDTGPTPGGLPSTVMALEAGQPVIYRPGAVSLDSIILKMKRRTINRLDMQ